MVLDIILVGILVFSMVFGFRKGFVYTFIHTLGWLGALIAAFILAPYARTFLTENTGVHKSIYNSLAAKFSNSTDSTLSSLNSLPKVVSGGVNTVVEDTTNALATELADLFVAILAFALVLFVVKTVFFTLTRLISKKENRGLIGFFDGVLGLVAGTLKGIILVFIVLALLLPAVNMMSPDSTDAVLASLDDSYFSRSLYDSNFIVLIVNDFFN